MFDLSTSSSSSSSSSTQRTSHAEDGQGLGHRDQPLVMGDPAVIATVISNPPITEKGQGQEKGQGKGQEMRREKGHENDNDGVGGSRRGNGLLPQGRVASPITSLALTHRERLLLVGLESGW